MNELTQFRGVLPPERPDGRPQGLPPNRATPGGLILHTLSPLRGELDAALARDDRNGALRLAYGALSRVADMLAESHGGTLLPEQVRVHALLVELETLPLEPMPDGTLAERGTAVSVNYRNWAVDRNTAAAWARNLTEQFRTLWPGAWAVWPET